MVLSPSDYNARKVLLQATIDWTQSIEISINVEYRSGNRSSAATGSRVNHRRRYPRRRYHSECIIIGRSGSRGKNVGREARASRAARYYRSVISASSSGLLKPWPAYYPRNGRNYRSTKRNGAQLHEPRSHSHVCV